MNLTKGQLIHQYKVTECLSGSDTPIQTYLVEDQSQKKKILKYTHTPEAQALLLKENDLLEQLKKQLSQEIIEPYQIISKQYFIRDYYQGLTLDQYLAQMGCCSENETFNILQQVAFIILNLQQLNQPVVHNDIQLENILMDSENKIRLLNVTHHSNFEDYPVYAAKHTPPEVFIYKYLSASTDIYALGCMCLQLLTGRQLHHLQGHQQNFDFIWEPYLELSETFNNLLKKMLTIDTTDRVTSASALIELLKNISPEQLNQQKNNENLTLKYNKTCQLMDSFNFSDALKQWDHILEENSQDGLFWSLKGLCHEALQQVAEAEMAHLTAQRYQDNLSFPIVCLANFWFRQKQIQEALNILENRYFPFTPSSIDAIETLIYCYYLSKQDNKAIAYIQSLLNWKYKTELYELLARLLQRNERFSEAIDVWQVLLKKYPHNIQWRHFLSLCWIQVGQPHLAQKNAEQILEIDPNFKAAQEILLALSNHSPPID